MTSSSDPEEIRREIEETREELGNTVEALAEKADVKAQTRQKIDDVKASAFQTRDRVVGAVRGASPESAQAAASQASQKARENPVLAAAFGAFLVGFLAGRLTTG